MEGFPKVISRACLESGTQKLTGLCFCFFVNFLLRSYWLHKSSVSLPSKLLSSRAEGQTFSSHQIVRVSESWTTLALGPFAVIWLFAPVRGYIFLFKPPAHITVLLRLSLSYTDCIIVMYSAISVRNKNKTLEH